MGSVATELLPSQPVLPTQLVIFIPQGIAETYTVTCPGGSGANTDIHYSGFYSFHGGGVCGSQNEIAQLAGGIVVQNWTAGSGDVWARRVYDRSCTEGEMTFTEQTTLELVTPGNGARRPEPYEPALANALAPQLVKGRPAFLDAH